MVNKQCLELIQGNQALQEQNKELERKVICLERRILPQMEGHLCSLEERLACLEREGSCRSSRGSLSGSSRLSRSGQHARRTGGPPWIPDENHHLVVRAVTPFPSVGRIAICQGPKDHTDLLRCKRQTHTVNDGSRGHWEVALVIGLTQISYHGWLLRST